MFILNIWSNYLKQKLEELLTESILNIQQATEQRFPNFKINMDNIQLQHTRDKKHGDFASNIAMVLAKKINKNPLELAELIIKNLPDSDIVNRVEVAGHGFINFFINYHACLNIVTEILNTGKHYGCSQFGNGATILIEFVSANPTGPLHVGHGRSAAYGTSVSTLLETIGYQVHKEYYVNDDGRQMDILTLSIWLRYLQRCGLQFDFPQNIYQGDYICNIANKLFDEKQLTVIEKIKFSQEINNKNTDPETAIDQLIEFAKSTLGDEYYQFSDFALHEIINDIKTDLTAFGVTFNNWFSEKSLANDNKIQPCIDELRNNHFIYEKEGALWLRSTEFGDEKDRVVIRNNGQTTYFASDIAYHVEKLSRGYDKIINIWGADHHGYIARVKAALTALGKDTETFEILMVQFVTLYRGTEKVPMSTRSGKFITLKELQNEIGKDAARFFYITRKSEQHLDFDLNLAKSESDNNPIYYIQYAHARICSVLKQLKERALSYDVEIGNKNLHLLIAEHEEKLITTLSRYPEVVHSAAIEYEPHQIAHYLRQIANEFHSYYNCHQLIVDSTELRSARFNLISAAKQVIANGLNILGISAPKRM